eukprot:761520-Pyramimonas_sp.AAC.1
MIPKCTSKGGRRYGQRAKAQLLRQQWQGGDIMCAGVHESCFKQSKCTLDGFSRLNSGSEGNGSYPHSLKGPLRFEDKYFPAAHADTGLLA